MRTRLCLVVGALCLAPATGWSADPDPKPKPITLVPKEDGLIDEGKVAAMAGSVGTTPHLFALRGLDARQPVGIVVLTKDESADLIVELTKEFSDGPLREARTKGKRETILQLRTDGDFTISIRSAWEETPYQLVAWVGEPIEIEMGDVLVPVAEYDAKTLASIPSAAANPSGGDGGDGGSTSPVMYIIAGALVLIVVLLGILVLRRGKKA